MTARSLKIALSTAALLASAGAYAQTAASPPPFNFMNHPNQDETMSNEPAAKPMAEERGGMHHRVSGAHHRRHMIQQ